MGIDISNFLNMKYFITILLTVSTISANSVFEDDESRGLCLEPEATYPLCVAGSNLEMKMPAALDACSNGPDTRRRKGKGKGKGQQNNDEEECPSFDDIIDYVSAEYGFEGCILQSLGWLDENMNENNATIAEDMASLMPEFSSLISEEEISQCVRYTLEDMSNDFEACANNFDEQQLADLSNMAIGIANYKCFERNFDYACNQFVYSQYLQPLMDSMIPAIRK